LAVFSEVRGGDATSCGVGHGLVEEQAVLVREGGDFHIGAAVEETVVTFDTLPQIGLEK